MPHIEQHKPGSFCWIELATTDQNAAKKFYPSLFGWQVNDMPIGPSETYTTFKLNGDEAGAAYTMRADEQSMGIPPHWNLYIAVENADTTAQKAGELGGKVLMGGFDVMDLGRMAVIQDPTGAVFCVWQAKRTPGMRIHNEDGALCWADLSTPDPERAKTFYEGLFEWKISAGEKDTSGYLHIQNGQDYIGGIPPTTYRPPNTPPHWLIYFQVADVDATVSKAKAGGAQVYMGPMSMENVGRLAVMGDPQGAAFSIFKSARGA